MKIIEVVRPRIEKVVVELSPEDAEALHAVAYGIGGPSNSTDRKSKGVLVLTVYPAAYSGTAEDLRDRLRDIGNNLHDAVLRP